MTGIEIVLAAVALGSGYIGWAARGKADKLRRRFAIKGEDKALYLSHGFCCVPKDSRRWQAGLNWSVRPP